MAYNPNNPNGQATMANSAPVVIASNQASIPVAATLTAETTKAIGVTRTADGSGNLLTSTTNALDINIKSGNLTTLPVTNAGTFASQATLQTQTDTVMVGGVNIKEINAVTPLMGNGTTGTGSLRVTLASDTTSNTNAFLVAGGKTNNNAAPGATNIGALVGLANAVAPTWTEGDQVLVSTDLSGNQRTTLGTLISGEDQTNNLLKVANVGGLMPTNTALNTYSVRVSTATTTTPTSSTAYISSIVICVETAAATATVDIRDKSGTPIYLIRSLSLASVLSNGNDTYTFPTPIKMTSGIDIITATSGSAATLGVFINYFQ